MERREELKYFRMKVVSLCFKVMVWRNTAHECVYPSQRKKLRWRLMSDRPTIHEHNNAENTKDKNIVTEHDDFKGTKRDYSLM
jgi:hypothetical protein